MIKIKRMIVRVLVSKLKDFPISHITTNAWKSMKFKRNFSPTKTSNCLAQMKSTLKI